MEGGSPSCCAGARGSTIRTTPAPPSGTATIRTMSTPTLASVPAVSPPQHPSPSEPLEGIPAGVPEGSRPAPVIGDHRWQGLPRANGRTIRTAPAHGPRPGLPGGLSLCAHTHHSAPAPWSACSSRARRRAALRTTSRNGLRACQSDRAPRSAPSGDQPPPAGAQCRWIGERPWGNREGQRTSAPEGHPPPSPIRFPGSSPPAPRSAP
jgi:hypothetical protein